MADDFWIKESNEKYIENPFQKMERDMLLKQLGVALEAIEEMHSALKGRAHERHITLASNPVQNGCLVYTEWKIKAIKEKALSKIEELTK
jgi:hypothetical protein